MAKKKILLKDRIYVKNAQMGLKKKCICYTVYYCDTEIEQSYVAKREFVLGMNSHTKSCKKLNETYLNNTDTFDIIHNTNTWLELSKLPQMVKQSNA